MYFKVSFILLLFVGCQYYGDKFPSGHDSHATTDDYSLTAKWGNGVLAGSSDSYFRGIAVDSSGNVYGVGRQYGNGAYTYATGVSATGSSTVENVSIVKYSNAGVAQWARSNTGGTGAAQFYAVATDSTGNVYAAGRQSGNGTYTYGAGVTATGTASSTSLNNVLLVKYDSTGTAQWARTNISGDLSPLFYGVTVDAGGNIYAVGQQNPGTADYGGGVTATGGAPGTNTLIVKYNSAGIPLWARATVSGTATNARFTAVAVDTSGNVYAVGDQSGTGTNTYGAGVTATGTASATNILIVKYDSSGTAIWARTTNGGTTPSLFFGVTVDGSGMIYASGAYQGNGTNNYGSGIDLSCSAPVQNGLLIKYDSAGNTLWARCAVEGSSYGNFWSVTALASGDIIVAGQQDGNGTTSYGSGITATGATSSENPVWVRYAPDGTARYARANFLAPGASVFYAVAADTSGNIICGGKQTGTGTYHYGDGITVTGSSTVTNAVMVKYGK
jgi:hypothetical protein